MRRAACVLQLFCLAGCGGNLTAPAGKGDGQDAMVGDGVGAALGDAGGDDAGAEAACPFAGGAEPEPLGVTYVDGGVPESELPFVQAVALCDYDNRCTPMATYERNECITSLSQQQSWNFVECTRNPPAPYGCGVAYGLTYLPGRFAGVTDDAGVYEPQATAACLQALEAEACHGNDLWWNIPACMSTGALQPRTTSADCAGDAGNPYCVTGYCYKNPCGESPGECTFAADGQSCDGDPPVLGGDGLSLSRQCAPGLTCRGATPSDGGLGTCAKPGDVGAACSPEAQITGCAAGLVCECGRCAIPASEGPCAEGLCEIGVAYCDSTTDRCVPVKQQGAACSQLVECASELTCDTSTRTCQLLQ